MKNYIISIDRQSRKFGIMDDGFNLVRDFEPYESEALAIELARAWIAVKQEGNPNAPEPEIVYPNVTRMTMTTSRRRRKKV